VYRGVLGAAEVSPWEVARMVEETGAHLGALIERLSSQGSGEGVGREGDRGRVLQGEVGSVGELKGGTGGGAGGAQWEGEGRIGLGYKATCP